ncbi:hypothetical protein [Pedobacter sp. JY14-1]|uniref:hypothetical protein n=1 Tax=Pedobacter sp. JY14-1 TaxID=3034151 RepID=UPI0023E11185|nr:hypothetical protein [Pedobacter sp. JY14-1]
MYSFSKGVNATPFQSLIFNEKLAEITSVYKRFFETTSKERPIGDYIRCFASEGKTHFHIKDGLPPDIARACKRAFYSIFA